MATKKPTKSTAVKTKTPVKAKAKAPVKKVTRPSTKRPVKSANKSAYAEKREFMSVQPNRETAYWVVLGIVVVIFGLWINNLQSDIQAIYDQIDASAMNEPAMVAPTTPKEAPAQQ